MSSRGLPEVLMQKVDEYVDSLAPQIQPRIASELEDFQQKTIDSLETQVVDAFRSLFNDNDNRPSSREGGGSRNLSDSAPDAYGGQSLPFADEIAKLTRGFGQISDEAGGDLREIFALTQGGSGGGSASRGMGGGQEGFDFSSGTRGFLSSALNAVQDSLNDQQGSKGGQSFEIGGLLGMLSGTIKEASRNPEEKARMISPEIKQVVGDKLRAQHAPIAEQFTRLALEHIKRWLRGNTSSRDLGEGAKAEIAEQVGDLVKGLGSLFGNKKGGNEGSARGFDEGGSRDGEGGSGGGFSRVISDKLSTGLAKVHREVRIEFRKILGQIEKQLFELLPDQFQRPLEKILGGNPFDEQLDRDASANADRGFGDDIKAKLLGKIRDLVRKVQETLRQSILGVVNGGHRRFERQSWVFVQTMVEQKVQRYLPDVKINVPDDIGNENVSVGSPVQQLGGGNAGSGQHHQQPPQQSYDRPPQGYNNEPSHQQQQYHNDQQYQRPPPSQDYRPDYQHHSGPPPHQQYSEYPPPQQSGYAPPPQQQGYQQQGYQQQGYQQQGYQQQGYPPRDYRDNNDGYQRPGY